MPRSNPFPSSGSSLRRFLFSTSISTPQVSSLKPSLHFPPVTKGIDIAGKPIGWKTPPSILVRESEELILCQAEKVAVKKIARAGVQQFAKRAFAFLPIVGEALGVFLLAYEITDLIANRWLGVGELEIIRQKLPGADSAREFSEPKSGEVFKAPGIFSESIQDQQNNEPLSMPGDSTGEVKIAPGINHSFAFLVSGSEKFPSIGANGYQRANQALQIATTLYPASYADSKEASTALLECLGRNCISALPIVLTEPSPTNPLLVKTRWGHQRSYEHHAIMVDEYILDLSLETAPARLLKVPAYFRALFKETNGAPLLSPSLSLLPRGRYRADISVFRSLYYSALQGVDDRLDTMNYAAMLLGFLRRLTEKRWFARNPITIEKQQLQDLEQDQRLFDHFQKYPEDLLAINFLAVGATDQIYSLDRRRLQRVYDHLVSLSMGSYFSFDIDELLKLRDKTDLPSIGGNSEEQLSRAIEIAKKLPEPVRANCSHYAAHLLMKLISAGISAELIQLDNDGKTFSMKTKWGTQNYLYHQIVLVNDRVLDRSQNDDGMPLPDYLRQVFEEPEHIGMRTLAPAFLPPLSFNQSFYKTLLEKAERDKFDFDAGTWGVYLMLH